MGRESVLQDNQRQLRQKMNTDNITPEERLLKLIKEGTKAQKQDNADKPAEPIRSAPQPAVPGEADLMQEKKAVSAPHRKVEFKKFFTITNVNKSLLVLFLLALAYAAYDLGLFIIPRLVGMTVKQNIDVSDYRKSRPAAEIKEKEAQATQIQPLTYYTQPMESRELFKSVVAETAKDIGQTQAQATKIKLDETVKALALKGIIAGEPRQAVIEDAKSAKTYFVTTQDKIGDIIIEEITDTRVRLKLEGQSADLTL